jgi:hypothetical protein
VGPVLTGSRAAGLREAMNILSLSTVALSRRIVCAITTATVLACIAVGFTVVLPGTSGSASGEAFLMKTEFDLVFASVNAGSHIEDIPKIESKLAFDQVFASMTMPQPDNTPSNREKLRNAGWRRVLQKS